MGWGCGVPSLQSGWSPLAKNNRWQVVGKWHPGYSPIRGGEGGREREYCIYQVMLGSDVHRHTTTTTSPTQLTGTIPWWCCWWWWGHTWQNELLRGGLDSILHHSILGWGFLCGLLLVDSDRYDEMPCVSKGHPGKYRSLSDSVDIEICPCLPYHRTVHR